MPSELTAEPVWMTITIRLAHPSHLLLTTLPYSERLVYKVEHLQWKACRATQAQCRDMGLSLALQLNHRMQGKLLD